MNTESHQTKNVITSIADTKILSDSLHSKLTRESIKLLDLEKKNRVLELGHGCCDHLNFLMEQAIELKYFGMEVSENIVQEASVINKTYIDEAKALFQVYDGENIPYVQNMFDRILSINTIYYWKNPLEYINELFRSLKPGGKCVVSFSDTTFLEQLPILEDKNVYSFYDLESFNQIIESSDFKMHEVSETADGFIVAVLKKKERPRYYQWER